MDVLHPTNFFQKVFEVIFSGESRQLRDIVQSDIDQTFCTGLTQEFKESGSRFFREAVGYIFSKYALPLVGAGLGFSVNIDHFLRLTGKGISDDLRSGGEHIAIVGQFEHV